MLCTSRKKGSFIRHLLGLEGLARQDILALTDRAKTLKEEILHNSVKKGSSLRGKAFVNLFFEPSTRTRTSFELAGKYLGADVINFQGSSSSVTKGETLHDTALNLEAMDIDLVVVRHSASGVPQQLQQYLKVPIVNAGDGFHEHPTQGLLDLLTVMEAKGTVEGVKVVIVGDILHSRVARSDLFGFLALGARVTLVGPPTLLPRSLSSQVEITADLHEALRDVDVLQVLRIQKERQSLFGMPSQEEYRERWGITRQVYEGLSKEVLILHPGPQNRGVEIDSDVMESASAHIMAQVENGVAVRMAVLEAIIGEGGRHG